MAKKTVTFNKTGTAKLLVDKIKTPGDRTNYVSVAKRGRAWEILLEHLDAGKFPGAKVQIEQASSIAEACKKEAAIISRIRPKYNEQGK